MATKAGALRAHVKAKTFLHMPSVYDPLGARLVEQARFEAAYVADMSPADRGPRPNR